MIKNKRRSPGGKPAENSPSITSLENAAYLTGVRVMQSRMLASLQAPFNQYQLPLLTSINRLRRAIDRLLEAMELHENDDQISAQSLLFKWLQDCKVHAEHLSGGIDDDEILHTDEMFNHDRPIYRQCLKLLDSIWSDLDCLIAGLPSDKNINKWHVLGQWLANCEAPGIEPVEPLYDFVRRGVIVRRQISPRSSFDKDARIIEVTRQLGVELIHLLPEGAGEGLTGDFFAGVPTEYMVGWVRIEAGLRLLIPGLERDTKDQLTELELADGQLSRPKKPIDLCKVYGMSWDALKPKLDSQQIRNKRLSIKSYRIHLDDLPPDQK